MNALAAFWVLSTKELRVLARDPQALGLLFGMPALLVFLLSLALKDIYNEKIGQQLTVILEIEDQGRAAEEIARSLAEEGNLLFVERPGDQSNREVFRTGAARAVVTIPAGFTRAVEDFIASGGESEFGTARIEWEASPSLDAAYRRFLEARLAITCLDFVQSELVSMTEELGAELEELGSRSEEMGQEMEAMGTLLEEVAAQLENTTALLRTGPEQLIEVAKAETLDAAARTEAEAVRAQLAARGADPEPAPPAPAELDPSQVVETELIDYASAVGGDRPRDPAFTRLEELREEREQQRAEWEAQAQSRTPLPAGSLRGGLAGMGLDIFLRESTGQRASLPTPLQQTVPGWSLFAMFFVVVPLSQGLHRERAEGTLRRILALSVPNTSIVLGKLAPFVVIGFLQFGGMLLVGMFVVPAVSDLSLEFGREPWVLIPITFAASLAASSYGLLIASLTKTPEQAAAFGPTSVVILSVVSGIMIPHFMMPDLLQKAAMVSPLYWGHQAYLDAFLHDAGLREVARPLIVLVGFACVCVLVAARRLSTR